MEHEGEELRRLSDDVEEAQTGLLRVVEARSRGRRWTARELADQLPSPSRPS